MRDLFAWVCFSFALLIAWVLIVKPIMVWRRARNNGKPRPPWGASRAEVAEFELEQQLLAGIKPPPPPPAPPRPVRAHAWPLLAVLVLAGDPEHPLALRDHAPDGDGFAFVVACFVVLTVLTIYAVSWAVREHRKRLRERNEREDAIDARIARERLEEESLRAARLSGPLSATNAWKAVCDWRTPRTDGSGDTVCMRPANFVEGTGTFCGLHIRQAQMRGARCGNHGTPEPCPVCEVYRGRRVPTREESDRAFDAPLGKPLDVECATDRFAKHEDARLLLIERAARAFVYGCSVEPENEDDVGDDRPMLPALKTAYDVKLWRELERAIACPAGWTPQEQARIDALMAAVDMEVVKAAPIGTQFVTITKEAHDALLAAAGKQQDLGDVVREYQARKRGPPTAAKPRDLVAVVDQLLAVIPAEFAATRGELKKAQDSAKFAAPELMPDLFERVRCALENVHQDFDTETRARTLEVWRAGVEQTGLGDLDNRPQAVDAARPTDKEFKP